MYCTPALSDMLQPIPRKYLRVTPGLIGVWLLSKALFTHATIQDHIFQQLKIPHQRLPLLKMALLSILSQYFLCSDSFRERACLWLWICAKDPGIWLRHRAWVCVRRCAEDSGMGLSSETRFGFGYTVRLWAFGL